MATDRLYIVDKERYEYILFAKGVSGAYVKNEELVNKFIEDRSAIELQNLAFFNELNDELYNKYVNDDYKELYLEDYENTL